MAETDTQTAAYAEGKQAAERGEAATANPHPEASDARRLWDRGHAAVTAPDEVADDIADFA